VAPCIYGGVQLGIHSTHADRWKTFRVPLPHGLIFVVFIPAFVGKTDELRKVVPKEATERVCVQKNGTHQ